MKHKMLRNWIRSDRIFIKKKLLRFRILSLKKYPAKVRYLKSEIETMGVMEFKDLQSRCNWKRIWRLNLSAIKPCKILDFAYIFFITFRIFHKFRHYNYVYKSKFKKYMIKQLTPTASKTNLNFKKSFNKVPKI